MGIALPLINTHSKREQPVRSSLARLPLHLKGSRQDYSLHLKYSLHLRPAWLQMTPTRRLSPALWGYVFTGWEMFPDTQPCFLCSSISSRSSQFMPNTPKQKQVKAEYILSLWSSDLCSQEFLF